MWRFLRALRPEWFDWFKDPEPRVFEAGEHVQMIGKPHVHGVVTTLYKASKVYSVMIPSRPYPQCWDQAGVEAWSSICSRDWKYRHLDHRRFTYWFPLQFTLTMLEMFVLTSALIIGAAKYQEMK